MYACTHFRLSHPLGFRGDNHSTKTLGMSRCHLVHVGHGTLRMGLGVRVLLHVTPSNAPYFAMTGGLEESRSLLLSSLSCSTLSLVPIGYHNVQIERDQNYFPFPLSPLYSILSLAMMIGSKTGLSLLVSEAKVYVVFSEPCEST